MKKYWMSRRHAVSVALMAGIMTISAAGHGEYRSPFSIAADGNGNVLYIAEYTANAIAVMDAAKGTVSRRVSLPGPPGGLALSPDGKTLFVTGAMPDGCVWFVETGALRVRNTVTVGHTPGAPVVSPDGHVLYVANRFNNTISIIDVAGATETARVAVAREPVAAGITPDGALLYVANHLPVGASDGDYIAAEVSVIDTASQSLTATIPLLNGSSSLRGLCVSPDGAHVYVAHVLSRYHLPTTQLERGWMNTNALSVIDASGKTLINTVLLDDVDLGAANPWGVACTSDGRYICVAHAGSQELSVIDRIALHVKLSRIAAGEAVSTVSRSYTDVPNDLSFLVGLKRRIKLEGNGPREVALLGNIAYIPQYFTDTVAVVDITADIIRPSQWRLAEETPMSAERMGEMFFNDAALCFQQWQSCASCHPDARVDGLNWDLLNDGIGNPKNTRNMLLSHQTPPVMSLGVRDKAETAVRAGIKFIQFAVRPEEDAVAIDAFLKSLAPVPSPYLEDGALSAAAQRGKEVFEKAKCEACHPAPLYTDLKRYDLETTRGMDKGRPVDTPTLIESWRTAPYLHDGRAATIMEVLTTHNPDDHHGKTSSLTEQELEDLVAYVLSH